MAVVFLDYPAGFGTSLGGVYLVWICTIMIMYPICEWFAGIKAGDEIGGSNICDKRQESA